MIIISVVNNYHSRDGTLMPLISYGLFSGAISAYACSHARATEYWAESLKSQCPFVSYSCEDYKTFNKYSTAHNYTR